MRAASLLLIIWASLLGATGALASDMSPRVPPGFEQLDAPRTLVLDMHHAGQFLGPVTVEVNGRTFRFVDPESLVGLLPINGDVHLAELASWYDTNVEKVCSRLVTADCGNLRTDALSFILDEERFRLDAFVAIGLLRTRQADQYLKPTHSGLSLTSIFDGSVAGTDSHADLFVQSATVASFGRARAIFNGAVSSRETFRAQEARVEFDHGSLRSTAGLFWSPTVSFFGRRRLVGLGVQSQWDTRVDRELGQGSELTVTVAQRSRVDVLESGRLLWTGFFEPGTARIDTRNLPEGAYPVLIRITGSSGEVREEEQFFVKDRALPLVGETSFHAFAGFAGQTTSSGTQFDEPIITASVQRRLTNRFAFGGGAVVTEATRLGELSLDYASERARLRGTLMLGSGGEKGVAAYLTSRPIEKLSFDLSARKLWSKGGAVLPTERYEETSLIPRSRYLQSDGGYTQVLASVSANVGSGSLRVHGAYTKPAGGKAVYSYGPTLEYPLLSGSSGHLNFMANALQTEQSFLAFAGVRFFKNLGATSTSGRLGYSHQSSSRNVVEDAFDDVVGDIQVTHAGTFKSYDLRGTVGVSREQYGHDVRGSLEFNSNVVSARAAVLQNINGLQGQTQYSASFRTAIGFGEDVLFVGAKNYAQSALRVEIEAPAEESFDVYVGDRLVGKASEQRAFATFLPPYREYSISVRPSGKDKLYLERSTETATLFPGGVAVVSFKARKSYVLFGRLTDAKGVAMANELLRTESGIAQSDADGYFQLDVIEGEDQVMLGAEGAMRCALPPFAEGEGFFRKVGDLKCD